MVQVIRKSMRIMHQELDSEIERNIDACLLELERVGVDTSKNMLVEKACELYVKSQFDYQGKGEQFMKNFEKLRDSMSLTSEYKAVN